MEWSDQQVMCNIISMLATQGWGKAVEEEESLEFIDRLVLRSKIPLEGAKSDCSLIKEEFQSLQHHAVHFMSLLTLHYRAV